MIRMRDDIPEEDMPLRRRFILTAPPPGYDVAKSSAAARSPRGQYDFVDTVETGQGLIRSPGHDAQTIAKAADRAKDAGYVRALQAFEHRMMTFIEEVNLKCCMRFPGLSLFPEARIGHFRQMMRTQVLEAKARIDTVEDIGSSY
ncbi:hypothetical protein Tco_0906416 [Tanacetum coccineum]|uniref:Uncharacterized protein n=1 Tax=Tanacetum coccineum TaxID=301880 RepID=A0ABQ5CGF4_9ASTR